jgi:GH25 family lysozyme M1 (1,4-beta-N-acetylmuramidase)
MLSIGDSGPQTRTLVGDVYDGDIVDSWPKAKAFGMAACWVKVCQGSRQDLGGTQYLAFRTAIKAAWIMAGPYHFPMFDQDPVAQANTFCDLVESQGGLSPSDPLDFCPMFDWEYDPETRGVVMGDGAKGLLMLQTIEARLKRLPVLYGGYYTMLQVAENEPGVMVHLARYPFLLAWYAPESEVKTPPPWTKRTFWQFSGNYPVPGVSSTQSGEMDAEWFYGSPDDLVAFNKASILP